MVKGEEALKKREYGSAIAHLDESMKIALAIAQESQQQQQSDTHSVQSSVEKVIPHNEQQQQQQQQHDPTPSSQQKSHVDNILRKMAFAYMSMNRIEESISCYMQLHSKYPNDFDISIAIALLYGKSNDRAKAIALFNELLAKSPNDPLKYSEIALYCEQLNLFDEAISYYEKSIELSHAKQIVPLINLGYIHLRIKQDCSKALGYLIQAELLEPLNLDLIYNIGMCYFHLKQYPSAIDSLSKCLRIDPNFHDAKRNLKYIQTLV